MLNSNLIELLIKFTPAEFKQFGEFVSSPFFNKNENVIKFFQYLKKQYPDFPDNRIEKKFAFVKIFGNEKYNDGYMRTLMFRLQKLAEEYLSFANYKKNRGRLKINLLSELNNRKLEKAFLKILDEQESEFEESDYKGYEYYNSKIDLEEQKLNFYNWHRYKSKDFKDYSFETISNSLNYIISAFLVRALDKYRFLLVKENFDNVKIDSEILDTLIKFLNTKDKLYKLNPVVNLHLNEILLMKTNDDSYFYKLKEILVNEKRALSQDKRYSLQNILNQYSAQRIFEGEEKFKSERLELYKIALGENIYKGSDDTYFDEIMFGGITLVAIMQKEYKWAEQFIEKYKNELPGGNKSMVVNFCLSKVFFAKKDFTSALKLLSQIKTIKHIQYKTAVRDMTLMCYYELDLFSQAYFMADSYRHFILKNKSFYHLLRYERISNFLKFFLKLIKIKENMNIKELGEVRIDLNKTHNILERDWLSEKLTEMENKTK